MVRARTWSVIAGVVLAASVASLAQSNPCTSGTPLLLANQSLLAFIDVDQNQMIGPKDCIIKAKGIVTDNGNSSGVATADMCFSAAQMPDNLFLLGCGNDYSGAGEADGPHNSGMVSNGEVVISFAGQSASAAAASGKAIAPQFPAVVSEATVAEGLPPDAMGKGFGGQVIGQGLLCNEGGLAAKATVRGVSGMVRFGDVLIGGVGYKCASLPFQVYDSDVNQESTQMLPLCFPGANPGGGNPSFAYEGSGMPLVELQVMGLPGCGVPGAPTASAWTLLAMATGLLAVGTVMLRRQRRFANALPRV